MLIGYEGGIVAYDFRQAMPVKTFEMTLPPGAPGGGTYDDANVSALLNTWYWLMTSLCGQSVHRLLLLSHGERTALSLSSAIPMAAWHSGRTRNLTNL